jgi:pSer/pThr/pTyr-binding forkhead associated (FHA) protein
MAKFCANGHQMEESWEICPYCQRTGYAGGGLGKTKAEASGTSTRPIEAVPPTAFSAGAPRKTVMLSQKYKAPVVGWFVALDGQQKGEDFRVRDGQNTIGSDSGCDVVLSDSTISARHASLRYKDGKFVLTDLDSSNGTFLNDQTESLARDELKDNDVIRLGDVRLKFKCL